LKFGKIKNRETAFLEGFGRLFLQKVGIILQSCGERKQDKEAGESNVK